MSISRKFYYFDWWLLLSMIILMVLGVISVYTASTVKIGDEFIVGNEYLRQMIWIIISLAALVLIIKFPTPLMDLLITPVHILVLILMFITLFMPEIKGASRWIIIGPLQLQPSELAKVTTILLLAKQIGKPNLTELQIITRFAFVAIPPILLLLLQPDLGTSIIFGVFSLVVLIFSDLPNHYVVILVSPFLAIITSFFLPAYIILLLAVTFVLFKMNLSFITIGFVHVVNVLFYFLTPIIWNSLKSYQQNRILTFLDPTRDPLGAGYQAIQSRIAIGSGMLQGKGFLEGTQKNLNFIPERHTDFIYSIIAEEFGFIGSMIILLLFLFFLYRLIESLKLINRREQRLFTVGVVGYLTTQIVVNIAINLGIFPTTGLPLPFISYGGSSMITNTLAVAIVLKYLYEKSFL